MRRTLFTLIALLLLLGACMPFEASPPAAAPAPTSTPVPEVAAEQAPPPAAVPVAIAAPELVGPPDMASIDSSRITFRWRWEGELQENQAFEVRGWLEGEPHNGIHDARSTMGLQPDEDGVYELNIGFPDKFFGNTWQWSVAVVQLDPYERIGPEAEPNTVIVSGGQPESPL
jgi:hypothetical protein